MTHSPGNHRYRLLGLLACLLFFFPTLDGLPVPEIEYLTRVSSAVALAQGSTRVFLPLLLHDVNPSACTPDPPGESDNVDDALIVCSGQTVTGWVENVLDWDDVYKIWVVSGQRLLITMSGYGGDADLYLYPPSTTNIYIDPWIAWSDNLNSNDEEIDWYINQTGYWFIDIYQYTGSTYYSVTTTVYGP